MQVAYNSADATCIWQCSAATSQWYAGSGFAQMFADLEEQTSKLLLKVHFT